MNKIFILNKKRTILHITKKISETKKQLIMLTGGKDIQLILKEKKFVNSISKKKIILSDERLIDKIKFQNQNIYRKKKISIYLNFLSFLKNNKYQILENIKQLKKKIDLPEIAILGIGSDGHILSIFNNNDFKKKSMIIKTKKNNENFYRASFSINYVEKIKKIYFIINFENKVKFLNNMFNNRSIFYKFLKLKKNNLNIIFLTQKNPKKIKNIIQTKMDKKILNFFNNRFFFI